MASTKIQKIDPTEIPEMMAFEEADRNLNQFKIKHQKVFEEYTNLVAERNNRLEAADQIVRGRRASCGQWECFTIEVRVDADGAYDSLGREEFLEFGGELKTVTAKSMDRKKVLGNLESGRLAEDVAAGFISWIPKYHAPKKISQP